MYSQCILKTLSKIDKRYKRLSEALEQYAVQQETRCEILIRKIGLLYSVEKEEVTTAILSMMKAHRTNPADIQKVYFSFFNNFSCIDYIHQIIHLQ